jgi:hypothetical protein
MDSPPVPAIRAAPASVAFSKIAGDVEISTFRTSSLQEYARLSSRRRPAMHYAMLIYESPEAFACRKSDGSDPYTGAWRPYYKAMLESGAYIGGEPLELAETATTIRIKDGRRGVQDGPYADTKEQLAGFIILDLPSLDAALEWAARCPAAAYGAVEVRPLAPHAKHRITHE